METTADREVLQLEELLKKPSAELRREIRERTGAALNEESPTEGTLEVWGVIKIPGASTGVSSKPITEFPLSEVYGYSKSVGVLFMSEAFQIAKAFADLQKVSSDDVDAEINVTAIWHKVRNLQRFVGISSQHDELIMSLQQLVTSEVPSFLSLQKLITLKNVFEILGRKFRLSEAILDELYDVLEDAGFDLGPAF